MHHVAEDAGKASARRDEKHRPLAQARDGVDGNVDEPFEVVQHEISGRAVMGCARTRAAAWSSVSVTRTEASSSSSVVALARSHQAARSGRIAVTTARARAVLPIPGGPTTVTQRAPARRCCAIVATSASRPMMTCPGGDRVKVLADQSPQPPLKTTFVPVTYAASSERRKRAHETASSTLPT